MSDTRMMECSRCHTPIPESAVEFDEWELVTESGPEFVCPRCLTLDDLRWTVSRSTAEAVWDEEGRPRQRDLSGA